MNTDLRHTDLRLVTRRVHSALGPLSERDQRVLERLARRAAPCGHHRQTLGQRFAERVVSILATLPGVTIVTGRKRQAGCVDRSQEAANEDSPSQRVA